MNILFENAGNVVTVARCGYNTHRLNSKENKTKTKTDEKQTENKKRTVRDKKKRNEKTQLLNYTYALCTDDLIKYQGPELFINVKCILFS